MSHDKRIKLFAVHLPNHDGTVTWRCRVAQSPRTGAGRLFQSKGGVLIESMGHPFWWSGVITLYVWGADTGHDHAWFDIPAADMPRVIAAIREYNDSLAKPTTEQRDDVVYWEYIE